jgi:hypothetical protein
VSSCSQLSFLEYDDFFQYGPFIYQAPKFAPIRRTFPYCCLYHFPYSSCVSQGTGFPKYEPRVFNLFLIWD